jgi:DNA-binding IclR family transcriptional regulator
MRLKGFKQYTEHTVQNLDQLMEKVKETRKQGYSVSWEDVTIGVASFGAPVRDFSKKIIGAISIGGIILHYQGERKQYFINLVKTTALSISKELGYVLEAS